MCNVSDAVLVFGTHSGDRAHEVTGPWRIVIEEGSFAIENI